MNIKICGDGNAEQLVNLLAWIELLGNIGHSADFKVFVDGDGNSRWKFKFEDECEQEIFNKIKKNLMQQHINNGKDIDNFNL